MIKEYKGCKIEFDEGKDRFVAYHDGEVFAENGSLAELKEQIDMLKKKTFARIPIYYHKDDGIISKGEITSFNSLQKEVWISYGDKEKSREKVGLKWATENLLRLTEKNMSLVENIRKNLSAIEELTTANDKLKLKLDFYTYKELCKLSGQTEIES